MSGHFNPASNPRQASSLWLVNPGDQDAVVSIVGTDDRGMIPGADVRLLVPARRSRTVSAATLETGAQQLEGRLGDGIGKWRLVLTSTQPIQAMSLLESPTGHLTNLSSAPGY